MLALNKLPQLYHPLFSSETFKRATDDKFFILVESKDPIFHISETQILLESLGASHVELVKE